MVCALSVCEGGVTVLVGVRVGVRVGGMSVHLYSATTTSSSSTRAEQVGQGQGGRMHHQLVCQAACVWPDSLEL